MELWAHFKGGLEREFSWKSLSVVPKFRTCRRHQFTAFTNLVEGKREGVRLRHSNCCILFYFLFLIIIINKCGWRGKKVNFPIHLFSYSSQNSLDSSLSLTSQIQPNNKGCQFYLQNRASLCTLPTTSTAKNLVQNAITSHLNYCNSIQPWLFSAFTIALFCLVTPSIMIDLVET